MSVYLRNSVYSRGHDIIIQNYLNNLMTVMSIGNVIWAKFDLNIAQQNTEHFSINQTRVYLLSY